LQIFIPRTKTFIDIEGLIYIPELLYPGDDERNRMTYLGQQRNGIPNGFGTMTWKDGQIYKGNIFLDISIVWYHSQLPKLTLSNLT
jgi:hypothetical protein